VLDTALDPATVCDHGVCDNSILCDLVTGHTAVTAVNLPVLIEQVDTAVLRIEHFHVCFPERRDGAYVFPVAIKMISVHSASVTQEIGDDIITEIILRIRIGLVLDQIFAQDIPVENVNSHRCQVGLRVLRLLLEFGDAVVLICNHQTETGSILPRNLHNRNTEFSVLFLVETKEITVILFADLVTGKNNHILGIIALNKRNILVNCIRSSLVPVRAGCLLIRREHMNTTIETVKVPRLSIADVLVENQWLILGQDTYGINTGIYAVGKRKVDDTILSAKRNCWFCQLLGQGIKPGTLAASKKHSNHFFGHKIYPPQNIRVFSAVQIFHEPCRSIKSVCGCLLKRL
jgi:hypothetical protein